MTTTANKLINKVLRRCYWPTNSSTGLSENAPLSDADVLEIADEVVRGSFWPELVTVTGGFYLQELDYSITADQKLYRLPNRHFGAIVDVVYVDETATVPDDDEQSIPTLRAEELGRSYQYPDPWRHGYYFVLQGDFVRLYPTPDTTENTLRIKYYRSPNNLVLTAAALQVTSTALATNDLLFGSDPDTLFDATDEVDVVSSGNAHALLTTENAIASFPDASTARLTNALSASGILAGDWMANTGETPIVQLPDQMIPALVRRVALECLNSAGEYEEAQRQEVNVRRIETAASKTTSPRQKAEPKAVFARNSMHRSSRRFHYNVR